MPNRQFEFAPDVIGVRIVTAMSACSQAGISELVEVVAIRDDTKVRTNPCLDAGKLQAILVSSPRVQRSDHASLPLLRLRTQAAIS